MKKRIFKVAITAALAVSATGAWATCRDIPRHDLEHAIGDAESAGPLTGGYGLKMWVTVVDETGKICHVATSGKTGEFAGNTEWLGSRDISAQKANTANAFSIDGYVISSGNLQTATEETGSLNGLQFSNPVNGTISYGGDPKNYGKPNDPLVGKRIGGVNVFGGGLALYKDGRKIGALGVSGDTSCRDHAYAWRIRTSLNMHPLPPVVGITTSNMNANGVVQTPLVGALKGDELIIHSQGGTGNTYWDGWAQPACPNSTMAITVENGTLKAQ
jgi:uncharacterized protein GlcG (DUF336 family)